MGYTSCDEGQVNIGIWPTYAWTKQVYFLAGRALRSAGVHKWRGIRTSFRPEFLEDLS
jgi:hypothetical protein